MKFSAIREQRKSYPIAWMCKMLGVSTSGFYKWQKHKPSARAQYDAQLAVAVKAAHKDSRQTYGSPRLNHELREEGHRIGRNRLMRIMRENSLSGQRRQKYVHTTDSNHLYPVAPNVLQRDFGASSPNEKWVGDLTYIATNDGWLYLALLVDLYSRKIVGWATSRTMSTSLPLSALHMALLRRRPPKGLIHHTDRGVQYASKEYRATLEKNGIVCSMSRRGDCYDNAPGESVFARIKDDLIYRTTWETRAQAAAAIEEYIEDFYNRQRRHSFNGFLSPDAFEGARHQSLISA